MTKTKDVEVTASELATWIGVGTPAIQEYARQGAAVRAPTRGKFFLRESVRGYIAHMSKVAVERENPTTTERTRLLKAEADSVENKVRALDKKLVSASSVAATWDEIKRSGRAALLGLPERIDARLPGRLTRHHLDTIRKEVLLALSPFDADGKPIPAPN